jgi:hypothetical protein
MPAAGWLINKFGSLSIVIGSTLGFGLALPLIAESNTVLTPSVALLFYGAMAGSMDVAMNTHAVTSQESVGNNEGTQKTGLEEIKWRSPPSRLRDRVVKILSTYATFGLLVTRPQLSRIRGATSDANCILESQLPWTQLTMPSDCRL